MWFRARDLLQFGLYLELIEACLGQQDRVLKERAVSVMRHAPETLSAASILSFNFSLVSGPTFFLGRRRPLLLRTKRGIEGKAIKVPALAPERAEKGELGMGAVDGGYPEGLVGGLGEVIKPQKLFGISRLLQSPDDVVVNRPVLLERPRRTF